MMMGGKGRTEEGRWKVGSGFEDDGLRREGFLVKEGFFEERPNKNLRRATKQASDIKKAGNFSRAKSDFVQRKNAHFARENSFRSQGCFVARRKFFSCRSIFDGQ